MRRLLLVLCLALPAFTQQSAINAQSAKQYFQELKDLSDQDAGRLWGMRLYGAMLFADPETRQVVANQPDKEGKLHEQDGVWVGQLPPEVPIANTGMDWAGGRWTMVMWPLPENRRPRKQLMAHEAFHRLQPQLGLTPLDSSNNHLDGRIGRTWLQLEWRALTRALATTGMARRAAIVDALYFRELRRSLIKGAAENENRLEANEGVAEYTGVKLSARYPQEVHLVASVILWNGTNRSPFTRSFAYVSGPAYGVLLDESGVLWRKKLKPDSDLGELLASAYHVTVPRPVEVDAVARARKYDGDEVIAQEKERAVRQQQVIATARKRLIDSPVLVLPASPDISYSFDPNGVTAIDENTSVFERGVKVTDAWGILMATSGVLIVRENGRIARVQVPAPANPEGTSVSGDGWKLDLKPGWKLIPGMRKGDWTVAKE
jgi:hypothetical protein